jgi:spermidine synthase
MTASFLRAIRLTLLLGTLLPIVATVCSQTLLGRNALRASWLELAIHLAAAGTLNIAAGWVLTRSARAIDSSGSGQARALDRIPESRLDVAIVSSAAASLFLEMAVIRWQGSVFELFALYKNIGLLACFAGLGLGYALAARSRIPLALTAPLLGLQMLLLTGLRHGMPGPEWETNGQSWRIQSLLATPFPEQRNMGYAVAQGASQYVAVYAFLVSVFLLTALAFIPVGQLCGRLMMRRPQLRAYALNLLGSLLGVLLLMLASVGWTPPLIWFAVALGVLLVFQRFHRQTLLWGALTAGACLVVLAWPVSFAWQRIYSPYQLIERGPSDRGLTMIRAAGHYYQKVHDLSAEAQRAFPERQAVAFYYEMPFRIHGRAERAAVLGAGMGNDVAAALRAGVGKVDAVEIDPVIHSLGLRYHPEKPYQDARVRSVVDDARTFLRGSTDAYDLIVFGLIDSHTLLSHSSTVRLESFIYTVEALKDARKRLKEDGILSLAFAVVSKEIGRKVYLMMSEAFDGRPPLCIRGAYDGSVLFVQRNHGEMALPDGLTLDRRAGFWIMERFEDTSVRAEVSTDDWPFLYMAHRAFPLSYLAMGAVVLLLSGLITFNFVRETPSFSHTSFFLLGAGFMLVETKAITELALAFGNTWQVVGIVIAGILVMAFLSTVFVAHTRSRSVFVPFVLLLGSLGLGLAVGGASAFPPTAAGRAAAVALLSAPVLFSGIVFARLLEREASVPAVMAINLLGSMLGGMLEYGSLYLGFRSLYALAAVLYLAAFVATAIRRPRSQAPTAAAS